MTGPKPNETCCTSSQGVPLVVHHTRTLLHKMGTKHVALGNSLVPTSTPKGSNSFTNLLHTTQASCTYLHNVVAHVFITTGCGKLIAKSLSSHAKHVSLGTRITCLLTRWWDQWTELLTMPAAPSLVSVCVVPLLYELLQAWFATSLSTCGWLATLRLCDVTRAFADVTRPVLPQGSSFSFYYVEDSPVTTTILGQGNNS